MAAKDAKPAKPVKPKPSRVRAILASSAMARVRRSLRILLPLATGTALLALGVFFAWQTWIVSNEQAREEEGDRARSAAIEAISGEIRTTQQRVTSALSEPAVLDALAQGDAAGREAATAAMKQAIPEIVDIEFYSPELNEIIAGDLAKFGYAKAQMLMQAQARAVSAPAQMRIEKGRGQFLVLALPVRKAEAIVAFAFVYLPFDPVLRVFRSTHVTGARLDLRQGDGRGDRLISSVGANSGNSIGDLGKPIPGSMLRIGNAEPEYFIVGPRDTTVLTTLSLICLIGGALALWLRKVGLQGAMSKLRRRSSDIPELTLTEALKQSAADPQKPAAASRTRPKDAVEAPVNIDRSIFRAYDIRGVVGETLTPAVARLIGRAVGSEGRERGMREIVIGRDGRLSGPDMVGALTEGLRASFTSPVMRSR
jgi:phosphomannomutase/phosphoglucomutase